MHRAFGADRGSGSQLYEMERLGIERPTLTNCMPQRFHRCDELRMVLGQVDIETRFVVHVHTLVEA